MAIYNPAEITVTSTATLLFTASDGMDDAMAGADLVVYNSHATIDIFVGGSDVTAAKGIPVAAGKSISFSNLMPGEDVYAIVSSTSSAARVLATGT